MKTKKKKIAGTREELLSKKVIIHQLNKFGLTQDETNKIYRELAAIKIQDSFDKKYINRIETFLNMITLDELNLVNIFIEHFINSINTSYEFKDNNMPIYLLNIKPLGITALKQINMLLHLKQNSTTLKNMFKIAGFNNLIITIVTSIQNIKNTALAIQNFRIIANEDYFSAQLGLETQPGLEPTRDRFENDIPKINQMMTTRKIDSVRRRPRTMRTQAITRKTKSI
tara:strand:- start:294 stop:974 length:681 start_codon:yes stop_codon:yes gene_type:complete